MGFPLDIRDLRTFTGKHLQSLLDKESHAWKQRLLWDYKPSTELLLRYLDARILPGLVALNPVTKNILGYCFAVYEAQKAVIGDVFALPGTDTVRVEEALLTSLIEILQNTPGIDRIESQLLLHDAGRHTSIFEQAGFHAYPRIFMESSLAQLRSTDPEPSSLSLPSNLRLQHWTTSHFQIAGELIYRSYKGHGDAIINDQYHSISGSLRFLHNIVRFPGCGVFDAESSWVVWDNHTRTLEGMVLCSTVLDRVAHITQICVAPQYRGFGIGHLLLRSTASVLARRRYNTITLTVTEANSPAVSLYTSLGFTQRTRFDAMTWQRSEPAGLQSKI